jgi:hypothetical protein
MQEGKETFQQFHDDGDTVIMPMEAFIMTAEKV